MEDELFTKKANVSLEKLKNNIYNEIKNHLIENCVVGNKTEITSEDVEMLKFKIESSQSKGHTIRYLFNLLGIILILIGCYFEDVLDFAKNEPFRFVISFIGILILLFSWGLSRINLLELFSTKINKKIKI